MAVRALHAPGAVDPAGPMDEHRGPMTAQLTVTPTLPVGECASIFPGDRYELAYTIPVVD